MDKDKINSLVAERLGVTCVVDGAGPCWKLQDGTKSIELPDWVEGGRTQDVAVWAVQQGLDMLCQLLPDGVVCWFEKDGETIGSVIYAETLSEAVCFAFLDLTDSNQSNNGRKA